MCIYLYTVLKVFSVHSLISILIVCGVYLLVCWTESLWCVFSCMLNWEFVVRFYLYAILMYSLWEFTCMRYWWVRLCDFTCLLYWCIHLCEFTCMWYWCVRLCVFTYMRYWCVRLWCPTAPWSPPIARPLCPVAVLLACLSKQDEHLNNTSMHPIHVLSCGCC